MSTSSFFNEKLDFALYAALEAEKIILNYYQDPQLQKELKKDQSVVTRADREAEQKIRDLILKHFPQDNIIGEELGEKKGNSEFTWIIDPIDGTQSFISGVPLFGTLIGLVYHGQAILGVAHLPALNERYYAYQGGGSWWIPSNSSKPVPARVSKVAYINNALFCSTSLSAFEKQNRLDVFLKMAKSTGNQRGWGDCYGHLLVATGRADIMVDPDLKIWDCAALFPIVTEAGGHFFDFKGHPNIQGGNGISTNARLNQEVIALINSK